MSCEYCGNKVRPNAKFVVYVEQQLKKIVWR